jgi:hypothetical protein
MNAATNTVSNIESSSTNKKMNLIKFSGRIEKATYDEKSKKRYSLIMTPAKDEYSKPSQFKLRSNQPLGAVGDEIKVITEVSGFIRFFNYPDKNTGEIKQGDNAEVFFDVVEK